MSAVKSYEVGIDMFGGMPETSPLTGITKTPPPDTAPPTVRVAAPGGAPTPPAAAPERPAWLPAKFATPEALAASYAALEQRLGSAAPATPAAPAVAPAAPAAVAVAPVPSAVPATGAPPATDVWAAARAEAAAGALKPETLTALKATGVPENVIQETLRTHAFAARAAEHAILQRFGGPEAYRDVAQRAAGVLTPAEKNVINAMFNSGDFDQMMAGAELLATKVTAAATHGMVSPANGGAPTVEAFRSEAEMLSAQMDKRYGIDEAYTEEVTRKIAGMLRTARR